jgi:hypothetical protein
LERQAMMRYSAMQFNFMCCCVLLGNFLQGEWAGVKFELAPWKATGGFILKVMETQGRWIQSMPALNTARYPAHACSLYRS